MADEPKPLVQRTHSRFAPSSLSRVLACPVSVLLTEALPPDTPVPVSSIWATEGSVAHRLAEEFLSGITDGLKLDDQVSVPPHVITVDDEMFEASYMFSDYVQSLIAGPHARLWREQVVKLDQVVGKDARCYGHLDTCVWDPLSGVLDVADFKYGKGIVVRVEDNPQLYAYALGALYSLVPAAERRLCIRVRLHVVQPRLGDRGTNSHVLSRAALDLWGRDVLRPVVRAIVDSVLDVDAPLTPGDHCRFCPVMQVCPALHKSALALAREAFSMHEIAPTPDERSTRLQTLDNETIAGVLDRAQLILPWIEELRLLAQERMEQGETMPGWKLVAKRGHRVWQDEEPQIAETLTGWGVQDIWQTKMRTAAQIEKIIPTALKAAFRKLWHMESSGFAIAPLDDPRTAQSPEAAKLFAKSPAQEKDD